MGISRICGSLPREAVDVLWHYKADEDFDGETFKPEPIGHEFSSVLVTREIDEELERIIEVPISGSKAPRKSRYKINFSGEDDPGDTMAIQQGILTATWMEGGEASVGLEMDWVNPLIEDGDHISLEASFDTGAKRGTRHFIGQIQSSKKVLPAKKHSMNLNIVRSREDLFVPPIVAPFGEPRVKKPRIGIGLDGRFVCR